MAIATINPFTGKTEQTFDAHSEEEVERRIAAAQDAFEALRSTTFAQRSEWMLAAAQLLEDDVDELGRLITLEMGRPIKAARAEVLKSAKGLRYYADHAEEFLSPEPLADPSAVGASVAGTRYAPIGIVLAVMPWNYPLWQVLRFAGPALMAGNTGLLKHASNVPQAALYLDTLFERAGFPVGARVLGTLAWQDYQWIDPAHGYRRLPDDVSSVDALGVLGMNALTAYFGVLDVAQPRSGEVLLVSGAAGSVGSIAAQIGRIVGARVVAICGGAEKAQWLRDECGIADVIDYKSRDVLARLDELCPTGVDVFFDNVGGALLRDVVARLRRGGRVALCGQIATYDGTAGDPPLDMMRIIYGAIRLQGFLVPDYAARYDEATTQLAQWLSAGKLAHREDIRDGLEVLPETFASLFNGNNAGTLIARISDRDGAPL